MANLEGLALGFTCAVGLALAVAVLRSASGSPRGRVLAGLLAAEALLAGAVAYTTVRSDRDHIDGIAVVVLFVIAGGIAAGAVIVLASRLNKVGEKVANATMPNVQATPAYMQFKKLEVYKAAVESAVETGGISDKERSMLERLAIKLALAPQDCRAIGAELGAAPPPGTPGPQQTV